MTESSASNSHNTIVGGTTQVTYAQTPNIYGDLVSQRQYAEKRQ